MLWFASIMVMNALALGQQPPTTAPAATQPAPGAPALLAGPEAREDDAGRLTLVKTTFDGKVESAGPEPDRIAIDMLDLTAEQRETFREIHSARLSAFDQIIRSNYDVVLELATLQGEASAARRVQVLTKAQQAFKPYLDRGAFAREMWPHLTDEQRKQAQLMIDEYRHARSESIRREAGGNVTPRQIAVREMLEGFGQMVRESIERQVGLEREAFEAIAEELALTSEQRNAAMAIFQPLAVKRFQKLEVTPAERAEAYAEFNRLLTAGQKQKLFGILLRQYQPPQQPTTAPAATQPVQ